MLKRMIILISFSFIFSSFSQADSGEEIAKNCNDCHGKNGVSISPDVPTIAGFSETNIADVMFAYVDETRPANKTKYRSGDTSRPEISMVEIAKKLSEEQIEMVAAYYSAQTFVAAKQKFDPALAKKGAALHNNRCMKCHADGGTDPDDDAGLLGGQWGEYLRESFKHYRDGSRESEDEMIKKVKALTEEQIEALLNYYASLQ